MRQGRFTGRRQAAAALAVATAAAILFVVTTASRRPAVEGPLPGAAAAAATERRMVLEDQVVPASGLDRLAAVVQVGDVRVEGGRRESVHVTAAWQFDGHSEEQVRRWMAETRVEVSRQGSTLEVRNVVPDALPASLGGASHPRLKLELQIPSSMGLSAQTRFGSTEVTGVLGDVTVESDIGDVLLRSLDCAGRAVQVKTSVGDVDMRLRSLPRERLRAEVGIGNVRMRLPSRAQADLRLTSEIGRATSRLTMASEQRQPSLLGRSLAGQLNGGGTAVEIQVATGDVRVE